MKRRYAFTFAGLLVATYAALTYGAACSPSDLPYAAAAAGYESQQLACVDQYATRADIDKCRDKVKAAWATDAGKDARE